MSAADDIDDLIEQIENERTIQKLREQFTVDLGRSGETTILAMTLRRKNGRFCIPILLYGDRNAKIPIEKAAEEIATVWKYFTDCEIFGNFRK